MSIYGINTQSSLFDTKKIADSAATNTDVTLTSVTDTQSGILA